MARTLVQAIREEGRPRIPGGSHRRDLDQDQHDPALRLADAREQALSPRFPTAIGRRRHSWPRCAMTASTRPACSTVRPMASAFLPTSNSSWSPRSSPTTSSCSTIWDRTKAMRFETRSGRAGASPLPAQILARPQPDRAALRQAQRLRPKNRAPNPRRHIRRNRPSPNHHPAKRMRKLSHRRRLRVA